MDTPKPETREKKDEQPLAPSSPNEPNESDKDWLADEDWNAPGGIVIFGAKQPPRARTPDEQRILDEVVEYRGGGPEARAWVESHVELILGQARMMGELPER